MRQKKLMRFAEIKTFSNVFENTANMRGNWNNFFKNKNEIILELACGKGEYTLGLAKLYPDKNFIGVDVKGNRIWRGAKTALAEGLSNVAFLRAQIQMIGSYFSENEVSEIWITFPDPHLRFSKMKNRLTHPEFLRKYQKVLMQNGLVHLKTDSPHLYEFTKVILNLYALDVKEDDNDIYENENLKEALKIKTHYEKLDIARSNRVHYLSFWLSRNLPVEKDNILKEIFREQTID